MDIALRQRSMRCSTFSTTCTSFVRLATSTGPPACQLLLTASEPTLKSVAAAEVAVLRAVTGAVAAPASAGTFSTPTVPVAVALLTPCVANMLLHVLLLLLLVGARAAAVCAGMTPGCNAAPACSCIIAASSASTTALQGPKKHTSTLYTAFATWLSM
jgi:hypothetical protein